MICDVLVNSDKTIEQGCIELRNDLGITQVNTISCKVLIDEPRLMGEEGTPW